MLRHLIYNRIICHVAKQNHQLSQQNLGLHLATTRTSLVAVSKSPCQSRRRRHKNTLAPHLHPRQPRNTLCVSSRSDGESHSRATQLDEQAANTATECDCRNVTSRLQNRVNRRSSWKEAHSVEARLRCYMVCYMAEGSWELPGRTSRVRVSPYPRREDAENQLLISGKNVPLYRP